MERVEVDATREKPLIADGECGAVADLRVEPDIDIRHVHVDGGTQHQEALARVLEGHDLLRTQAAERMLPCDCCARREREIVTTEDICGESETKACKSSRGVASPARQRSRATGFGEGRRRRIG